MINVLEIQETDARKVIPMCEMEPLQIGVIESGDSHQGHIVMRTASTNHFEVMDLTEPEEDNCWSSGSVAVKVELFRKSEVVILEVQND